MHLTKQRHEHGSLSSTSRPDNEVDRATLESEFVCDAKYEVTLIFSGGKCSVVVSAPSESCIADSNGLRVEVWRCNGRCGLFRDLLSVPVEKLGLEQDLSVHIACSVPRIGRTFCRNSLVRSKETLAIVI